MNDSLLEVNDLTIRYRTDEGYVTAVSDANFKIGKGEYMALVGESGCGKSTIANSILGGLDSNAEISDGEILFKGQPLHKMTEAELNSEIRWKEISWIPQTSLNTLNPLDRIGEQAVEIGKAHTDLDRETILDRLQELFPIVGIQSERVSDYPHQFSGGMRQRVMIAFSLILEPSLVVADEPTTALDVIMQDQVFKYLDRINEEQDASMLLISHDISLGFESCDKMAVMHSGQIAETGAVSDIYENPKHPYTILLQQSFPDIRFPDRELVSIEGYPPQLKDEVEFCTFVDRCPWATQACEEAAPDLESVPGTGGHRAACFHKDDIDDSELNNLPKLTGDHE